MIAWCEAYVPVGAQMVPCKAPALAAFRYRCVHGHVVVRSTCAAHDPVPGQVGCHECHQTGREEPMTFELVEVVRGG